MATKYDFTRIALMWRPKKGQRRICVGMLLVPKDGNGLTFEYSEAGVNEAKKVDSNFSGYPGLPLNAKNSPAQVAEVFFGRLINKSRNDAVDFYDFWLVDKSKIDDPLYILAQTQGLSASDMFEFVPQYFQSHRPSFITDIAGISKYEFDLSSLNVGDELTFTLERDNPYDSNAVYVSHNGKKIGYIKKGHNTVFNRKNIKGIRVSVWSITNLPGFEKLYVRVDIK